MNLGPTVAVQVNGEHRRVHPDYNVAQLVRSIGLDPARVAVERNLEIVPRGKLEDVRVEDGDEYEIVHFVGGG